MPSVEERPEELQVVTVVSSDDPVTGTDAVELTQTDKLNNILLKSLLNRMNTGRINFTMNPIVLTEHDEYIDFEG